MNSKDVQLDTRLFCLFKGDPGSGKSIAAGSFPGKREDDSIGPYFIDVDRRIKSVINFWRRRGREFDYIQPDSFFEANRKLEEFMAYCPYQTIVFDGITTGGKMILRNMKETRGDDKKKVLRAGIELAQIEDYGGESAGLDTILNNLQVISIRQQINVVVTAHVLETTSTDIKTKSTTISRTLLTGGKKVAASLPVYFDEAYHFDVQSAFDPSEPPKHTVVTHNVGEDWAKTALPLPIRIDFTNKSLYDEIMLALKDDKFVHSVNVSTPIITPQEEFDARVEEDEKIRAEIQGFK